MRSSSATVVPVVNPLEGVVLVPLAVLVRSKAPVGPRPENSLALTARPATLGCVMVIVLPTERGTTLWAARITVRTWLEFRTSAAIS